MQENQAQPCMCGERPRKSGRKCSPQPWPIGVESTGWEPSGLAPRTHLHPSRQSMTAHFLCVTTLHHFFLPGMMLRSAPTVLPMPLVTGDAAADAFIIASSMSSDVGRCLVWPTWHVTQQAHEQGLPRRRRSQVRHGHPAWRLELDCTGRGDSHNHSWTVQAEVTHTTTAAHACAQLG
eukprot:366399-Chlamydomonas_euryale.AAC.18